MNDKKLYEIWYITPNYKMPVSSLLSVWSFYRDEVVSLDLEKLNRTKEKLEMRYGDEQVSFEIREVIVDF